MVAHQLPYMAISDLFMVILNWWFMAAQQKTILKGREKPEAAVAPMASEYVSATRIQPGASLPAGSLPTSQGLFVEEWEARLNAELWQTGPDGTMRWRDQADGFFE